MNSEDARKREVVLVTGSKRNGRYRHGGRTKEAIEERRAVSKLIREARASIARL